MSTFKAAITTTLSAALLAGQIGPTAAAPLPTNVAAMKSIAANGPIEVYWRGGWGGWGWGAGAPVVAGAIIGGAIAGGGYYGPGYYYGYPTYPYYAYYAPRAVYSGYGPYYGYAPYGYYQSYRVGYPPYW